MTGAGAGQHTGRTIIGLGQQQSSSSSANTLVWNPASVIIRDNASPIKTKCFVLLVIITSIDLRVSQEVMRGASLK